ncbi:hypothetical protein V6N13_047258 [Hibiscus sabdariffa]|uniref:Uncharacterized protein n=1 Tax=Hibiscus sabdariffa TaxID=183260 RepID=A0ABR2F3K2_9ROSI
MLAGNKCDLENSREVGLGKGKSLAESERLFFVETSVFDLTNVQITFEIVIREIYNDDKLKQSKTKRKDPWVWPKLSVLQAHLKH